MNTSATPGDATPGTAPTAPSTAGHAPVRRPRIGLVAGGLGAYWPQFPDLLPQLRRSAARVAERMGEFDADVVDAGFVSDAQEGAQAAEKLRAADCDLIVGFLTTYMTATMLGVLREDAGAVGLVTANGGFITKHAFGVYSTEPPAAGFRWEEPQDEIDASFIPVPVASAEHEGAVTVEAYTVMHDREGAPELGIAAVLLGRHFDRPRTTALRRCCATRRESTRWPASRTRKSPSHTRRPRSGCTARCRIRPPRPSG